MEGNPVPLKGPIPLKGPLPLKVLTLAGFQGLGHLLHLPQGCNLLAGAFLGNGLKGKADLGRSAFLPRAEGEDAQQGTKCRSHMSLRLPSN